MKAISFGLLLVLLFFPSVARTDGVTGRVVAVLDGNTVEITTHAGITREIKLGFNFAPTGDLPFSAESKSILSHLCLNKEVTATVWNDVYGEVFLGKMEINNEMLLRGAALYPTGSDLIRENYLDSEVTAKSNKRGVWGLPLSQQREIMAAYNERYNPPSFWDRFKFWHELNK